MSMSKLKNSSWTRVINFLLILNFINLSANFYISDTRNRREIFDPIDTVAEIFIEYIFEMEKEIIPDTEIPNGERKFKDFKLYFEKTNLSSAMKNSATCNNWPIENEEGFLQSYLNNPSPPPKLIFTI